MILAHLLVAGFSVGLAFVPLFNLLGFEFAVTMGTVLAYASGWRACASAAGARAASGPATPGPAHAFPGAALLRAGIENLSLLLLPLAVICVNAWRVPTCNWGEGLQFYLLFPAPGVLYGTSLGFLFGLLWPTRRARLALVLWSLATYVHVLWNVVREPPIFGFNAFVGFFPGPVYDRLIPISARLVLARGIVVMEAVLFATLALLLWDGTRARLAALLRPWNAQRAVPGGIALLTAVTLGMLAANGNSLGLRIDRAYIQRTLGGHIETEHCHIYYDADAYTPERAAELAREHEFHYAELREFFGVEPPQIGSYVYGSGAQKKRLMGAAGTSFEDALNDEFHINAARWPHPVLRHEMAHIFAAHLDRWWRICPQIGIHEGIAVAAEWREESAQLGLTPDEACVAMDSLGVLPDVGSIMGALGFWTQAHTRAYTTAGSFVRFLVDMQGMERFRRLWSSRDFEATYGRSLDDLIAAWRRQRLSKIRLTPEQLRRAERRYLRPAVFAVPCAHEIARLQAEASRALGAGRAFEAESLYAERVRI
ncbi:MAG: hypothetical protein ACE5G2_09855, partial [Candidatus Krumholzibacteriia bacterium]